MRAAVRDEYGKPDRVHVRDVPMLELTPEGVLVGVRAASLNRIDWYELTGSILVGRKQMGMRRPTLPRLGFDFAGVVEAAGADVSGLAVGDDDRRVNLTRDDVIRRPLTSGRVGKPTP